MLEPEKGWNTFAEKSEHPKHRHAAIVFYNGMMVAWSNNTRTQHAERRALEIAKMYGYITGLTLISIAVNKQGKFKLARPCKKCEKYARLSGVVNIYFSTNEQYVIKLDWED